MNKAICLYLHVHQPYRVRDYTIFDAGQRSDYFDQPDHRGNRQILDKVADKSYVPTNAILLHLLQAYPQFRITLSITGVLLEQLAAWRPDVLESFRQLVATGRVEIMAETYHHSLAFFYSEEEFNQQVEMHHQAIAKYLNAPRPTSFRNTELAYNNDLAAWAEAAGYRTIIAEGWDPILGWRSSNHVYRPTGTSSIKLLTKNYKLSDDLAFRFGDKNWPEYPMTASKFSHWLSQTDNAEVFNLFMDYETFGEHQWDDSGIFDFLAHLPHEWLKTDGHTFLTVSEASEEFEPKDYIDVPQTISWADTERDLSAWMGNAMQIEALRAVYDLRPKVMQTNDLQMIETWRKLTTSDHFYYMSTKYWNDGDVHAYFSPFSSPYEAQISYMNVLLDIKARLAKDGLL